MKTQIVNFNKIITYDPDKNDIVEYSSKSIIIENNKIKEITNKEWYVWPNDLMPGSDLGRVCKYFSIDY